jgi:hypothetical protein
MASARTPDPWLTVAGWMWVLYLAAVGALLLS